MSSSGGSSDAGHPVQSAVPGHLHRGAGAPPSSKQSPSSSVAIVNHVSPAGNQSQAAVERRVTAHHEAGHAGAAARVGGRVDGIDISYTPLLARGWTAVDVPDITDITFYTYAGSWAQTRLIAPDRCHDREALWTLVRTNSDDWAEIQRSLGRTVTDSDMTGAQIWGVENRNSPLPGELRPDTTTVLTCTTPWKTSGRASPSSPQTARRRHADHRRLRPQPGEDQRVPLAKAALHPT